MSERPPGGRARPASGPRRTTRTPKRAAEGAEGEERIAKWLARAGVGSRRGCEALIEAGEVSVNGKRVTTPAQHVSDRDEVRVGRRIVEPPAATRLWRYHKPAGLITTNHDPKGRRTIFEELPKSLPRVVTIGRLDLNTEGLLLLTNDGALARALELPSNAVARRYRARAHGTVTPQKLAALKAGVTVEGVRYGPIETELEIETGSNNWLTVALTEGRKREVRRALESQALMVNRLIRVAYGPFDLGDLPPGGVDEVAPDTLAGLLGDLLPERRAPRPTSRLGREARSGTVQKKPGSPARPRRPRGKGSKP